MDGWGRLYANDWLNAAKSWLLKKLVLYRASNKGIITTRSSADESSESKSSIVSKNSIAINSSDNESSIVSGSGAK